MSHPHPGSIRVGLIDTAAAESLTEFDWQVIRSAQHLKTDLAERPKQTGFRVFSILIYKPKPVSATTSSDSSNSLSQLHPYDNHNYVTGTNQQLAYITGTNTEPCFIGCSICSERSALVQLRMKRYSEIVKLFITADSDTIITPGLLCREMLSEFFTLDTPIVLAAVNAKLSHGFDVQVTNLRQLYPYPSIYLNVPGSTVQTFGEQFHAKGQQFRQVYESNANYLALYHAVVKLTDQDKRPGLHPIRYAAGVRFTDGTTKVVAMTKLLEYGWSLDPIVKLVPFLEEKKEAGIKPELIIEADQFGNLHSPTAPARSHLTEYGYNPILIFHERSGKLVEVHANQLAPDVPDAIEDVLPTTVGNSEASPEPQKQ